MFLLELLAFFIQKLRWWTTLWFLQGIPNQQVSDSEMDRDVPNVQNTISIQLNPHWALVGIIPNVFHPSLQIMAKQHIQSFLQSGDCLVHFTGLGILDIRRHSTPLFHSKAPVSRQVFRFQSKFMDSLNEESRTSNICQSFFMSDQIH
jgi:hypothetical protein